MINNSLPSPPLDIPALIESSRPGGNLRRLGLIVPVVWILVFIAAASQRSGSQQTVLSLVAICVTLGVSFTLRFGLRAGQREQQFLSQVEDQLALKNAVVDGVVAALARPMRSAENRLRALILLATGLARQNRSEEALQLYDYLLDDERVAGPGGAIVRVARAMALLRADRLFDADRAISDLRQRLKRPVPPPSTPDPLDDIEAMNAADALTSDTIELPATLAAPLGDDRQLFAATRLVELYRDVKTGHNEDAVALFNGDAVALRGSLGHRYGEALALNAAAHDRLGHPAEAAEAFAGATALTPAVELISKYPELAALPARYPLTPPPPR